MEARVFRGSVCVVHNVMCVSEKDELMTCAMTTAMLFDFLFFFALRWTICLLVVCSSLRGAKRVSSWRATGTSASLCLAASPLAAARALAEVRPNAC